MNAHVALTPDDLATLHLPGVELHGHHLVWLGDDAGRTFVYVTPADCRRIGDAWHNVADGLDTGLGDVGAMSVEQAQEIAREVLARVNRGGAL